MLQMPCLRTKSQKVQTVPVLSFVRLGNPHSQVSRNVQPWNSMVGKKNAFLEMNNVNTEMQKSNGCHVIVIHWVQPRFCWMLFLLSRPTLTYILHLLKSTFLMSDIFLKFRFLGQRKFHFLGKRTDKYIKKRAD